MRLHDFLDYVAREQPDAECLVFAGRAWAYAEVRDEANRIANGLIAAGLQRGDRAAILAKNCAELVCFYYGAFKAGVAPVPLNYRLAPAEWAYIVNDAGAKALVARGELVAAVAPVRGELRTVERCLAIDAAPPSGWEAWNAWVAAQPATPPDREVPDDADAYQMYTSGTTGHPKGAVLAHRAVCSNVIQLMPIVRLGRGDRYLIVAPLYHAAAAVTAFTVVASGGALFVQEDFVPGEVVRALAEENLTAALLVPAMIQACLVMVPDVAARRYDALRLIVYGASPIAAGTLRRAIEVFQCGFMQGYGMTETSAVLTALAPADHERALAARPELLSAGRPLLGTALRIVDDQDRPLPTGAIGEIVGRGPQLMRGYWNLAEASAAALRDGWMHTGDAGRLDEEGYLYIEDRVKDMIVSGGENVYPREVENVLFQHPAVADAAVIGVPDPRWGETVKAIVVRKAGADVTADALIEHCRAQLGGYKLPRSVDFVDALPRNPSGKVLKRELREPYWAGHTRRVS
ncbi:MAG: long-chain-fatty-acid--CoA ligase [Candidatus Binatia bacterium]